MKNSFTIFYSWQSDIRKNRNLIQNCINKAIKAVHKKRVKDFELEINIDRDTSNKSGSPAIAETIFKKIENCDIFICDTTIVNKNLVSKLFGTRHSPNPNVLIELGFAIHVLGWPRIICVNDSNYAPVEELPFDIRGHRITSFNSSADNAKDHLTTSLTDAIASIVDDFDTIIKEQNKHSRTAYDRDNFAKINTICDEPSLNDSLSVCVDSLFITGDYLDQWDNLQQFYRLSNNHFLDNDLDGLMKAFLSELNAFHTIVVTQFHQSEGNNEARAKYMGIIHSGIPMTEDERFEYRQMLTYSPHKEPFSTEDWSQADRRIAKLQDALYDQATKVKDTYRAFVQCVKQKTT